MPTGGGTRRLTSCALATASPMPTSSAETESPCARSSGERRGALQLSLSC